MIFFADTWFWIALLNPNDDYHKQATIFLKTMQPTSYIVTVDEVLVELLTYFASRGFSARQQATQFVEELFDSSVEVVPQTRDSLCKGIELYKKRPDKKYSLTDCISMQTMKAMDIHEVLTHDHHFTQEGFKRLLN